MAPSTSPRWNRLRNFVMRHRLALRDLSIILAGTLVALYGVYAIDVFANEDDAGPRANRIELDEALLVGGLVTFALLLFSIKQYWLQRREVTRRIAAEQHARELAYRDGLTGLPNRRQFEEALAEAVASPPRAGAAHAVFFLDLNGFKRVNDIHGHATGDEVLVAVGHRLLSAMREGDMVARFGGDEFAILATHVSGPEAATNVAMRVIEALDQPVAIEGEHHEIGAGIGIALVPHDATASEEAMRKADIALYRAKTERRSALRFFEPTMDARVRERAALEQALRAAVTADAIEPVFRPTLRLRDHTLVGFEMSPRWTDAEGQPVPPERFIAIAEETGLIHQLAEQVLRKACLAARHWPEGTVLSTDLYPGQLRDSLLPARIARLLHETGLAPHLLDLEITESALVADPDHARALLGVLRAHGVRLTLDNFGTGYSSLYHLRNIRLDTIKIDRSFVQSMATDAQSAGIVSALAGLGRGLGLTVAVEGLAEGEAGTALPGEAAAIEQGTLLSAPLDMREALLFCAAGPGERMTG
jgi:diguanylate cyclase (GGDEF)-like protein